MGKKGQTIKRQMLTKSALRLRETGDGEESRTITGYAILFNTPSAPLWEDEDGEAREVIDPAAVTKELLDGQDIKMTLFHDNQLLLARSREGEGTLSYRVDEKGVAFEFEAPATVDGDKAVELVRRGDLSGCSFAFTTRYYDEDCVERTVEAKGGRTCATYRVKVITGVYDFTLTADPAYPDTSVEARALAEELKHPGKEEEERKEKIQEQLREMRQAARYKIV